jgi:hypothetical protein
MIEALLMGKLTGTPESRASKGGRPYVQARLRVPIGADESVFVRLTAFSESVCTALLALDDGDAAAVAGTLKPGAWVDRDGAAKPNLDLVVGQVLSVHHLRRRRQAMQPSTDACTVQAAAGSSGRRGRASRGLAPAPTSDPSPQTAAAFGAALDDAWLAGGAAERTP